MESNTTATGKENIMEDYSVKSTNGEILGTFTSFDEAYAVARDIALGEQRSTSITEKTAGRERVIHHFRIV